jgi:3-deoxy-D-manno-octulosonic-acid transferase
MLADFDVFIIDTIGILTKIYSYADIAFVGGGFGNLSTLLEPATLESQSYWSKLFTLC